eukprot:TRINITY_DN6214_c0_g1_i2.p1 TRINITY_DN6214_c0_g1~~TRINITY_DN6214_c0_g1_i2.p1  ORF type:complete len:444 (+),score=112.69 TRINITY_DN6214_c0_g1_i2:70-1401(+)
MAAAEGAGTAVAVSGGPILSVVRYCTDRGMQDMLVVARYARNSASALSGMMGQLVSVETLTVAQPVFEMIRSLVRVPLGLVAGVVTGVLQSVDDAAREVGTAGQIREGFQRAVHTSGAGIGGAAAGLWEGAGDIIDSLRNGRGTAHGTRYITQRASNAATGAVGGVTVGVVQGGCAGLTEDSRSRAKAFQLVSGAARQAASHAGRCTHSAATAPLRSLRCVRRKRQKWFNEQQAQRVQAVEDTIEELGRYRVVVASRSEDFRAKALEFKRSGRMGAAKQALVLSSVAATEAEQIQMRIMNLSVAIMSMNKAEVDTAVAAAFKQATSSLEDVNRKMRDLDPEKLFDGVSEAMDVSAELAQAIALDLPDDAALEAELAALGLSDDPRGPGPAAAPMMVGAAAAPAAAAAAPARAAPAAAAAAPARAVPTAAAEEEEEPVAIAAAC